MSSTRRDGRRACEAGSHVARSNARGIDRHYGERCLYRRPWPADAVPTSPCLRHSVLVNARRSLYRSEPSIEERDDTTIRPGNLPVPGATTTADGHRDRQWASPCVPANAPPIPAMPRASGTCQRRSVCPLPTCTTKSPVRRCVRGPHEVDRGPCIAAKCGHEGERLGPTLVTPSCSVATDAATRCSSVARSRLFRPDQAIGGLSARRRNRPRPARGAPRA